jgi:hypothetical protein
MVPFGQRRHKRGSPFPHSPKRAVQKATIFCAMITAEQWSGTSIGCAVPIHAVDRSRRHVPVRCDRRMIQTIAVSDDRWVLQQVCRTASNPKILGCTTRPSNFPARTQGVSSPVPGYPGWGRSCFPAPKNRSAEKTSSRCTCFRRTTFLPLRREEGRRIACLLPVAVSEETAADIRRGCRLPTSDAPPSFHSVEKKGSGLPVSYR